MEWWWYVIYIELNIFCKIIPEHFYYYKVGSDTEGESLAMSMGPCMSILDSTEDIHLK